MACFAAVYSPRNPTGEPRKHANVQALDVLTVLRTRSGNPYTKRFTPEGKIDHERCTWFDTYELPVSNIVDVYGALCQLTPQSRLYVIRGRLTGDRHEAYRVRRLYLDKDAAFERADRRWLGIDIDGAPAPAWLDPTDPDSLSLAVRWAIRTYLPACFHEATCAYQWSSSAGIKWDDDRKIYLDNPWSKLRLHLFFWLTRPASDPTIKAWLFETAPHKAADKHGKLHPQYIDVSLYQPVQPHYTAAPIFQGMPDPLGAERVGLLRGTVDNVEPPAEVVDLATWKAREQTAEDERKRQAAARAAAMERGELQPPSTTAKGAYARKALDNACHDIETSPEGTLHATIRGKSYSIGAFVNADMLDRGEALAALTSAAAVVSKDTQKDRRTIESGLDRAPAFDVSRLAVHPVPIRRIEIGEPPDDDTPPPGDTDAPPDLYVVPEAPVAPHWPTAGELASTPGGKAELAKQREMIAAHIAAGELRARVERETLTRKGALLKAAGLCRNPDAPLDDFLAEWRPKIEAVRAAKLAQVRAELAELAKRTGKRAAAKAAQLDAKAAKLAGPFSVKAEVRKRKAEIARQARAEAMAALGVDKLKVSGERLLVTGAQGTGKSTDAQRAVANIADPSINVALFVPSHKRAWEAAGEYNALRKPGSLPAIVVLGRGAPDPQSPDGERMCPRADVIEPAAAAGANVLRNICGRCPQHDGCGYMRQMRELDEQRERGGALYILSHAYAVLPPPPTMAHPDLVIVDESILPTMAGVVVFSPDRLTSQTLPLRALNIAPGFENTMQLVRAAVVKAPGRELAELRERGVTLDEIRRAKRALDEAAQERLEIDGRLDDATIRQRVLEYEGSEAGLVALLLRQIAREWNTGRDGLNSVSFAKHARVSLADGKTERQGRVYVGYLKTFRLGTKRPLLALDGTANLELNRRIFGRRLREVRIAVERNAEVIQVRGKAFGTSTITGCMPNGDPREGAPAARAARLRAELAEVAAGCPDASKLVVTTLRAEESVTAALADVPGVAIAHFNDLRGVNTYKDRRAGLIIGREEPKAAKIEHMAGAYAATDPEPLKRTGHYVDATRGRRMRDGTGEAETVKVHPDPRCQAVLEQIREAELAQAVDRLRLIFNAEPKRVYLLTSIPVDVTVDRSARWAELARGGTRLDLALAALPPAILAVTAETLAEICNTKPRVERIKLSNVFRGALRASDLTATNAYNNIGDHCRKPPTEVRTEKPNEIKGAVFSMVPRGWTAAEYVQAGPPCRCLVRNGAEPYAAIESVAGRVRWVRVAGDAEPLPRPPADTVAPMAAQAGDNYDRQERAAIQAADKHPRKSEAPYVDT